ncbi:MAG TPA: PQQ-binding-like beta-propeller repeat protein [Rugosimonospora sp.]
MVIELDTDWEPRESPHASGWRIGRRSRLVVGLLVCLLLVSGMAGSATPAPIWRLVASVPAAFGDFSVLSGDRVFVMRQQDSGTTVDAYGLPGGRHLWRAALSASVDMLAVQKAAGELLAEAAGVERGQRVTALDVATGRVLWRLDDAVFYQAVQSAQPDSSHVLLMVAPPSGPNQLRLVDVRSGAAIWSRVLMPGTTTYSLGSGKLVLDSPAGPVWILDEDTGRSLLTARLDTGPPPVDQSLTPGLGTAFYAIGGRLVITYHRNIGGTDISAYDMSTVERRWHLDVDDSILNVADCAAVLCLSSEHGMTAIDPATAERRWTTTRWTFGGAQGGLIDATDVPNPANQLNHTVLLDPGTGRTVLDLRDWSPQEPIVSGQPATLVTGRRGRLGAWVGSLNQDRTAVRPQAFLPDAIRDRCVLDRAGRTYLACATYDGPVDVWVDRPAQ